MKSAAANATRANNLSLRVAVDIVQATERANATETNEKALGERETATTTTSEAEATIPSTTPKQEGPTELSAQTRQALFSQAMLAAGRRR